MMLNEFYCWLGKWKNTPEVWNRCAPLLLIAAILVSLHARGWAYPVALYLAAQMFVPQDQDPEAQRIHALIGYLCTHLVPFYIGFVIIPISFFIEYYWDPKYEPDPWKWGGVWDFVSYSIGAIVGVL